MIEPHQTRFDGFDLGAQPDPLRVVALLGALCQAIEMTPMPDMPQLHRASDAHYMATLFIAESHIMASVYGAAVFVDVFSCKAWDEELAEAVIRRWLGGEWTRAHRGSA